jgi:hypothetical protein
MPFLDTEDMRTGALPEWLSTDGDVTLDYWTSEGPVPADLRAHFPTSQEQTHALALHRVQAGAAHGQ